MTYPHQPENIKVCPGCGTNLIITAKHCVVCGYVFTDAGHEPHKEKRTLYGQRQPGRPPRLTAVIISLPVLLGVIIVLLGMNYVVILGMQKRAQTKTLIAAEHSTATFIATTYVSPTPSPTPTRTPAPPTETPEVEIEYTVVSGDSCLSIAKKFNLYLDSLLYKNKDLDCATLQVGTVLKIPHPTPTPEVISTETVTPTTK